MKYIITITHIMSQQIKNRRLESLDILRGADLFFLLFFQPVFMSFARTLDEPALAPLVNQFTHVHWEGFAFWDLIMPLFMFMAGVSMPFSLAFSDYIFSMVSIM